MLETYESWEAKEVYLVEEYTIIENIGKLEGGIKENKTRYDFAMRFNKLLYEKGIMQKDFCIDIGISSGALSNYRKGTSEPSITTAKKIADYLDVSVDYLLGIEEIQSRDTIDKEINKRFGFSDVAIKALSYSVSSSKTLKGKNLAVEALNILFTPYDDEAKQAGIPDLRFIWHLRDYLFTTTDDYRKSINKRMFNTAYGTEKVTTEDLEEISFNRVEKRLKFLRRLTQKRLEAIKLKTLEKENLRQNQIAETALEREIEWDSFTAEINEIGRIVEEEKKKNESQEP